MRYVTVVLSEDEATELRVAAADRLTTSHPSPTIANPGALASAFRALDTALRAEDQAATLSRRLGGAGSTATPAEAGVTRCAVTASCDWVATGWAFRLGDRTTVPACERHRWAESEMREAGGR